MENKTAMIHLIDKILRMPESNIKGFLRVSGPAYIEAEKEQIKDAYKAGCVDEMWELKNTENEEHYYNKTFANDTTKGLPEENSKRRGWHY